jgi:hypothetical protein
MVIAQVGTAAAQCNSLQHKVPLLTVVAVVLQATAVQQQGAAQQVIWLDAGVVVKEYTVIMFPVDAVVVVQTCANNAAAMVVEQVGTSNARYKSLQRTFPLPAVDAVILQAAAQGSK